MFSLELREALPAPIANMTVSPAGVRLSIWMAVFTGITTAVIALRIWAVHLTRKSLQLSDYLVIVAYVRFDLVPALRFGPCPTIPAK